MKIGIQTWGSDGDILPHLALAGGLRAAGLLPPVNTASCAPRLPFVRLVVVSVSPRAASAATSSVAPFRLLAITAGTFGA